MHACLYLPTVITLICIKGTSEWLDGAKVLTNARDWEGLGGSDSLTARAGSKI